MRISSHHLQVSNQGGISKKTRYAIGTAAPWCT